MLEAHYFFFASFANIKSHLCLNWQNCNNYIFVMHILYWLIHLLPFSVVCSILEYLSKYKLRRECVHKTQIPLQSLSLINRKLTSDINEICIHDTTHGAKAAYQIPNHSHQRLLRNVWFKLFRDVRTDVRMSVKLNAPRHLLAEA